MTIIIPPSKPYTVTPDFAVPDNSWELLDLLRSPIEGIYRETRSHRTANGTYYQRATTNLFVGVSVAYEADEKRWFHLSVSHKKRMPTHDELCEAKNYFIGIDRYAVQVYPPAHRHVNIHPHCLHLFSCLDGHPLPEFSRKMDNGERQI